MTQTGLDTAGRNWYANYLQFSSLPPSSNPRVPILPSHAGRLPEWRSWFWILILFFQLICPVKPWDTTLNETHNFVQPRCMIFKLRQSSEAGNFKVNSPNPASACTSDHAFGYAETGCVIARYLFVRRSRFWRLSAQPDCYFRCSSSREHFNTSSIWIHWELCLEGWAMGNWCLIHFSPPCLLSTLFPQGLSRCSSSRGIQEDTNIRHLHSS